jgi:hypothetical protein
MGVHFRVRQKTTSPHPSQCQRMSLVLLAEHRCATTGNSALCATTMGQYSLGHESTRSWVVSFKVALVKCSVRNEAFRVCSTGTAHRSKPRHLTNVSYGRRGQRGVFPETAAAGAAQPGRSSSPKELPLKALTDTDVNVSIHPAPIIQPFHPNNRQWANIHSW